MRDRLSSAVNALFDRGGVRGVFDHARNALVGTVIVAAGIDTSRRNDAGYVLGLVNPLFLSYFVAAIGFALIAINFIDGLRRIRRFRWHAALQVGLTVVYIFVSFRIIQMVIFYRTHGC